MDLSYNRLSGSVPPEIGSLTRLEGLGLQHNELTGPAPETADAVRLALHENEFEDAFSTLSPNIDLSRPMSGLDLLSESVVTLPDDEFGALISTTLEAITVRDGLLWVDPTRIPSDVPSGELAALFEEINRELIATGERIETMNHFSRAMETTDAYIKLTPMELRTDLYRSTEDVLPPRPKTERFTDGADFNFARQDTTPTRVDCGSSIGPPNLATRSDSNGVIIEVLIQAYATAFCNWDSGPPSESYNYKFPVHLKRAASVAGAGGPIAKPATSTTRDSIRVGIRPLRVSIHLAGTDNGCRGANSSSARR